MPGLSARIPVSPVGNSPGPAGSHSARSESSGMERRWARRYSEAAQSVSMTLPSTIAVHLFRGTTFDLPHVWLLNPAMEQRLLRLGRRTCSGAGHAQTAATPTRCRRTRSGPGWRVDRLERRPSTYLRRRRAKRTTARSGTGRHVIARGPPPSGHPAGASTTAEFWPPMPKEVLRVMPPSMGVGPSRSRWWPSATAGGAGITLCA